MFSPYFFSCLVADAGLSVTPFVRYPALGTAEISSHDNISCTFLGGWHPLHVFSRLAPVACFPALSTVLTLFRNWHRLHGFPRFASVCTYSRACHGLHTFRARHRLRVFPRLAPVARIGCLGKLRKYCGVSLGNIGGEGGGLAGVGDGK